MAMAGPVSADPISYVFSTSVTQSFGPVQDLFGRTFVRGDRLSGRVTIDPATVGPDIDARDSNGEFVVGTGRVVFDVPSGFSMEARAIERFHALTENSSPGASVDYFRFDLFDPTGAFFNALLVTWVDPAGTRLSNTMWPTNVQGFGQTEVRFNRFSAAPITLYGDSPAPVPEPGTLALLGAGLAGLYRRARRPACVRNPLSFTRHVCASTE